MFETKDRSPAGAKYQSKKETFKFVFLHAEPISEYYRPEMKEAPQPVERAPDRYSVTSEYLIGIKNPDGSWDRRILCVEGNYRVAIEREAARVRYLSSAGRWPDARRDWWTSEATKDGYQVACVPAGEPNKDGKVERVDVDGRGRPAGAK